MRIELYNDSYKGLWDDFVKSSKNGTFLHCRDFIEYHGARFKELSYLFFDTAGNLLAIMAGHVDGRAYYTHNGLTYGGLVMSERIGASKVLKLFECLKFILKQQGFAKLYYKAVPHIYHRQPAEEDLYALFRCGAKLSERHISSAIDLRNARIPYSDSRKNNLRKSIREEVQVVRSFDYGVFWEILSENLYKKYGKKPVHSMEEIEYLAGKFSDNIKLLTAIDIDGRVCGGCVLFVTDTVVHIQYVAATESGKKAGAVDRLIDYVIHAEEFNGRNYFDYGISTENNGQYLNESLVYQKEGFGARAILYDIYMIDL